MRSVTAADADRNRIDSRIRKGDERKYFEAGLQVPSNDPSVLASAIAYATEHLGIAFTASILQEHPFNFARRISTLDHATKGRIAWNIVTNYLPNASRNFGLEGLTAHDARYAWADEYVDVTYKLWEGSWDDDALLQDREAGIHADYDKVHRINHVGERYQVEGPHLVSPSPQRTPFLFQGLYIVPTSTEAEAARVAAELDEWIDHDGHLAHMSGSIGIDFGHDDLDTPVGEIQTEGVQSAVGWIRDLVKDRPATLRDVAHHTATSLRIVGTPEKIADELAAWQDAGVDGINLMNYEIPTSYEDFVDHVIPTLRERGLIQSEYSDGTLRQKIFGEGDRLPDRHHATRYRGAFGAGAAEAPDEALAGAVN